MKKKKPIKKLAPWETINILHKLLAEMGEPELWFEQFIERLEDEDSQKLIPPHILSPALLPVHKRAFEASLENVLDALEKLKKPLFTQKAKLYKLKKIPEPKWEIEHLAEPIYEGKFVIQLHHATRKHFDLRLEIPIAMYQDVYPEAEIEEYERKRPIKTPEPKKVTGKRGLMSWAIPKAKVPKKGEKLLAVMTELHPYSYLTVYGEIPEPAYGAGTVKIYDIGDYALYEFTQEKIAFALAGTKIHGEFRLILRSIERGKYQYLWMKVTPRYCKFHKAD